VLLRKGEEKNGKQKTTPFKRKNNDFGYFRSRGALCIPYACHCGG
jgi:hypothetical protein